jgi:hypothetical protein
MFGCIVSTKNVIQEDNGDIFVDDSLKVFGINTSSVVIKQKNLREIFNLHDSSIIEIEPKTIVIVFDDYVEKDLASTKKAILRKILYNGTIIWLNEENLFIFDKIKPKKILSIRNTCSFSKLPF